MSFVNSLLAIIIPLYKILVSILEGGAMMKYKIIKLTSRLAPMALVLATLTANSTCFFYTYQPKVPQKLIKKSEND